jgi:hypothetical protein
MTWYLHRATINITSIAPLAAGLGSDRHQHDSAVPSSA